MPADPDTVVSDLTGLQPSEATPEFDSDGIASGAKADWVAPDAQDGAPETRLAKTDVQRAYQLVLGRDPESDQIIEGNVDQSLTDLLDALFSSLEFHFSVNQRFLRRRRPRGGLFDAQPSVPLIEWVKEKVLAEDPDSATSLEFGSSWLALYRELFQDTRFAALFGLRLQPSLQAVLEAIDEALANPDRPELEIAVEELREDEIRGWALDPSDPDCAVAVQLFLDGAFAGSVRPDRFRRDIQDQFGGAGKYGFVIPVPSNFKGLDRQLAVSVRDAGSGDELFHGTLLSAPPKQDEVRKVSAQLARLRESLDAIEASLPNLIAAASMSLDSYEDYAAAYSEPASVRYRAGAYPIGLAASVIVDASNANIQQLSSTLDTLVGWGSGHFDLTVVSHASPMVEDALRRVRWRTKAEVRCIPPLKHAVHEALSRPKEPQVIMIRAGAVLMGGVLPALLSALAKNPNAALIYGDDDLIIENRRSSPRFRPGFDLEILCQYPDLGDVFALRAPLVLAHLGEDLWPFDAAAPALALNLALAGAEVVHLNLILCSRTSDRSTPPEFWETTVQAALDQAGDTASVSRAGKWSGGFEPLRIERRELLANCTATVIIPTRDRPDLLGPCLRSLQESKRHNNVQFDIIVIDNGSVTTDALQMFEHLSLNGVKVLQNDAEFNWALLNNFAAEHAQGEILVFLNDDTLVISPDWCDALCEQAGRAEVGAVGALLLYEDGTIQHAGVVLRDERSYAAHEGVGALASDPGYLGRNHLVHESMAVTGACLATRKALFEGLGGFDSVTFPVEGNDVDYCLRVRDAGYKVLYTPYASLHHLESKSRKFSSSGQKMDVADRAVRDLWARWGKTFPVDPFFNAHFDRRGRPFAFLRPPPRIQFG
jgi:GT2 family glycosyltransferase